MVRCRRQSRSKRRRVAESGLYPPHLLPLLAGILALAAAMGIGRFAYTPLLPAMQEAAGLDPTQAGLLAAANYAGYLAGALLAAVAVPASARIRILLVSAIAVAVTTALMAATTDLAVWSVVRFVAGLASAGVLVLATGLVLDDLRRQGRVSLSGWLFSGVGLGIVVSGVVVRLTGETLGWRGDWLLLALHRHRRDLSVLAMAATRCAREQTTRSIATGWPEHAPADANLYKNFALGSQGTGGSTAIANSYEQMRKAGAAARAMLAEAAESWRVPAGEISVERGALRHAKSSRQGRFGQSAEAVAKLPVPGDPPLKDPSKFRLIGREGAVKKLDVPAKTNGTAQFTIDIREPGMLTVVVFHPPRFGSKVASVDAAQARAVPGVVDVKQIRSGVAVYADSTWPALKAREALRITG